MRTLLTILLLVSTLLSLSQDPASRLIGKEAPDITLYDSAGNRVKLSSFKGKVIYLDFWSTTCSPCIRLFPHEDSLANRINLLGLDTSIVIVKVCHDPEISDWRHLLRKYHQGGTVNLRLKGNNYPLQRKLDFVPYPSYYIIGKDFRFLGAEVARPDDKYIDYYLYRATQGVSYAEATREANRFREMPDPPAWFLEFNRKLEGLR